MGPRPPAQPPPPQERAEQQAGAEPQHPESETQPAPRAPTQTPLTRATGRARATARSRRSRHEQPPQAQPRAHQLVTTRQARAEPQSRTKQKQKQRQPGRRNAKDMLRGRHTGGECDQTQTTPKTVNTGLSYPCPFCLCPSCLSLCPFGYCWRAWDNWRRRATLAAGKWNIDDGHWDTEVR